jgi:diaminopimelate decarboxylase
VNCLETDRDEGSAPLADIEAFMSLLPAGSVLNDQDTLEIGGCDATELAREFGTPVVVVSELALRAQAIRYRDGLAQRWPASRVVFASKAFPCAPVERVLAEEGLGCDVVGRGELAIALSAGFEPERIYLQGNAKDDADFRSAVEAGVGTIVLDCLDDLDRLERFAPSGQRVLIRVNPDVHADTHEKVLTGHAGSKFGLPPTDVARVVDRLESGGRFALDGVHVHIGSQILDTVPFEQAVESVGKLGLFAVYDLGGGLGVRYTREDPELSIEDYLDALVGAARQHLPTDATILIEPGRSMVAQAAVTIYTASTVKHAARTFVAVDGGMADNLEPALYGTRFEATIANRVGSGQAVDLVGRHCETGDVLIPGASLREPVVGDVVVVPVTGAYCYSLQNNYNGALKPPVVFVNSGDAKEVVRRETVADLLRRDVHEDHSRLLGGSQ